MLEIKCDSEDDYRLRWRRVAGQLLDAPVLAKGTPLQIRDRDGLVELSFVFFVGWLFTSILNQSKLRYSLALVPVGAAGDSSILILYRRNTHLATPARKVDEFLDPDYFTCPLDRVTGRLLSETEKHLCPVVNKVRYNLSQTRGGDFSQLKEPHKTARCCDSRKADLWTYLKDTVQTQPDLYGTMVGGTAFPIALPYQLLDAYLTGTPPSPDDFGKLLEETLLWFAMAASGVLLGRPHARILGGPVPSLNGGTVTTHEIDVLLYDTPADKRSDTKSEPQGGWAGYLADQSVCLIELTVGHKPDQSKKDAGDEDAAGRTGYSGAGNDKPINKLTNFNAINSYGFREVQTHYITATGSQMNEMTHRALTTTPGFYYTSLADVVGQDIGQKVLEHEDSPVTFATAKEWHAQLIAQVERAAVQFRDAVSAKRGS